MQQAQGDVHEVGPFSRKIKVQDALDHLQQLLSNRAVGGGEDGEYAIPKAFLFIFGYQCLVGVMIALGPAAVCPILEIDDGCEKQEVTRSVAGAHRRWADVLEGLDREGSSSSNADAADGQ
jgi:hypothetical protein